MLLPATQVAPSIGSFMHHDLPSRSADSATAHRGAGVVTPVSPIASVMPVTMLNGTALTAEQVLDRVHADGALAVICRGSGAQAARWRGRLTMRADSRGLKLTIDTFGPVVLLTDTTENVRLEELGFDLDQVDGPAALPDRRETVDRHGGRQLYLVHGGPMSADSGDGRSTAVAPRKRSEPEF
jgi:hypothetical protein